jgi:hypothetical protein
MSVRYWRKGGSIMVQYMSYITDFKKAYGSVRKEALYNILSESEIPTNYLG